MLIPLACLPFDAGGAAGREPDGFVCERRRADDFFSCSYALDLAAAEVFGVERAVSSAMVGLFGSFTVFTPYDSSGLSRSLSRRVGGDLLQRPFIAIGMAAAFLCGPACCDPPNGWVKGLEGEVGGLHR